jgi:calcineurin-like phosphoesterase family protein
MSKNLYTADLHLFHKKIIKMCNRPFDDTDHMEKVFIENWNSVANKDDDTYVLGDFSYKVKDRDREHLLNIFNKLNGRKHLIIGNHDHSITLNLPWSSQPVHYKEIFDEGNKVVLFHYGMRMWNNFFHNSIHLYGHSHDRLESVGNSCDVGVDSWNYKPVDINQIKLRLQENPSYNPEITQEQSEQNKNQRKTKLGI